MDQSEKDKKVENTKQRFSGAVRINTEESEPQFIFNTTGALSSFHVDPDFDDMDVDPYEYIR